MAIKARLELPVRAGPHLWLGVFQLLQVQGSVAFHFELLAADVECQRACQIGFFQPEPQADVGGGLGLHAGSAFVGQDEKGHIFARGIDQAHIWRLHGERAGAGVFVAHIQIQAGIAKITLQGAAAQLQRVGGVHLGRGAIQD